MSKKFQMSTLGVRPRPSLSFWIWKEMASVSLVEIMLLQLVKVASQVVLLETDPHQRLQQREKPSSSMARRVAIWAEASWGGSVMSQSKSSKTGPSLA